MQFGGNLGAVVMNDEGILNLKEVRGLMVV